MQIQKLISILGNYKKKAKGCSDSQVKKSKATTFNY